MRFSSRSSVREAWMGSEWNRILEEERNSEINRYVTKLQRNTMALGNKRRSEWQRTRYQPDPRFKRHVGRDYAIISGVHGEREILTRIVTPAITLERKGTTGAIVGPWHEMFSVLNRQTCPLPPLLPEIFARYLGEVKVVITAP